MPTIDLSTPAPEPDGLLDSLPRRAALTLPELRIVAERAGGAPLPFDLIDASVGASPMEQRLGQSRGTTEAQAYEQVIGSLHEPVDSLTRRGLIVDGVVDEGLLGAVGLLATPELALDIDLVADGVQAKSWQRQAGEAVATLSTVDGIVFELAWFPTSAWPAELGRVAVIPEDVRLSESQVPDAVDLPYELADAASEAVRTSRTDLIGVLAAQHAGAVRGPDGAALSESEAVTVVGALSNEGQGRLRAMIAAVSAEETTVVGVVSWVLVADGWRALRAYTDDHGLRVAVRKVAAAELGAELAPVLAEVMA